MSLRDYQNSMQAPEIFKKSLEEIVLDGLPPRDDPGYGQAVLSLLSLEYAVKGCTAAITLQDGVIRGIVVPQEGIEPQEYVIGLLHHGFLEDALPSLEILSEMTGDAEINFNYGLCLSELGRVEEALEPLQECLKSCPEHLHARVALGVAYTKLGNLDQAESVLRKAAEQQSDDYWVNRNLAGVLSKQSKFEDATQHYKRALSANPSDLNTMYGLALNLEEQGGESLGEADEIYRRLIEMAPNDPMGEEAKKGLTRISKVTLRKKAVGDIRMDAVMYMQGAIDKFAKMTQDQVVKIVHDVSILGDGGLAINNPDKRYALKSLDGDFSGLHLLCLMHVGLQMIDPSVDSQSGLDKEYQMAMQMSGLGG